VILLDQRETQIDAGSDTCGRPYLPTWDEERLRDRRKLQGTRPVARTSANGDDAALVEQTTSANAKAPVQTAQMRLERMHKRYSAAKASDLFET
jgi:hypothetical protein